MTGRVFGGRERRNLAYGVGNQSRDWFCGSNRDIAWRRPSRPPQEPGRRL